MSKKLNNQKITLESIQQSIESLAIATTSGFERVDKNIVEIKDDISGINQRMTGIEQRMTGLESRLDTFVDHERRLTKVETVLNKVAP